MHEVSRLLCSECSSFLELWWRCLGYGVRVRAILEKTTSSTEYYSVVSMVKNTRCVLVQSSIETNTHLIARQGSPIFLICLFFLFERWRHNRTGRFLPHARDESDGRQRYWRSAIILSQGLDWILRSAGFWRLRTKPVRLAIFSTVCSRCMVAALGLS